MRVVVADVIADDVIEHEKMAGMAPGKEGVRRLFTTFHHTFGDASLEVHDLVAESDTVVAMQRMTGTQRGEIIGLSSTGRTINVGVADRF